MNSLKSYLGKIILLLLSLTVSAQRQNLIQEYTFDTSVDTWYENSMFFPYSAGVSSYTKIQGKSLKVEYRRGDRERAELGTNPRLAPKEGWYGFGIFFPSSFVKDPISESIVQFQSLPDFSIGEGWDRSAVFALGVMNDRLIVELRSDTNKITHIGKTTFKRVDLGALKKSRWQYFVLHANWSYGSDGFLKLWQNDKLVLDYTGPTSYNDILNPYFKIGIYKWDFAKSAVKSRTIYIDGIRIGNSKATYPDVYPGKKLVKTVQYFNDGTSTVSFK